MVVVVGTVTMCRWRLGWIAACDNDLHARFQARQSRKSCRITDDHFPSLTKLGMLSAYPTFIYSMPPSESRDLRTLYETNNGSETSRRCPKLSHPTVYFQVMSSQPKRVPLEAQRPTCPVMIIANKNETIHGDDKQIRLSSPSPQSRCAVIHLTSDLPPMRMSMQMPPPVRRRSNRSIDGEQLVLTSSSVAIPVNT